MSANNYIRTTILAWHALDEYEGARKGNLTVVYPQYAECPDGHFISVPDIDFPSRGAIQVRVQNEQTAGELYDSVGSVVEVTLSEYPSEKDGGRDLYFAKYSQLLGSKSQIWLEPISSNKYIQILKFNGAFEDIQLNHSLPVGQNDDDRVYTNTVIIQCQGKYWGPFAWEGKEDNLILSGLQEYQYKIAAYSPAAFSGKSLKITDPNGYAHFEFIPNYEIPDPEKGDEQVDWISDDRLLQHFFSCLKTDGYSADNVRTLKRSIAEIIGKNEDIEVTPERVKRLEEIIDTVLTQKVALTDVCNYILGTQDLCNSLVATVCNDYFDLIEKKIKEYSGYQEKIEDLKIKSEQLATEVDKLSADKRAITEAARSETAEQLREMEDLINQLDEKKKSLSVLISLGENIESLQDIKEQLLQDIDDQRTIYDHEKSQVDAIKRQLADAISRFRDEAAVIEHTLAPVIDREILSRVMRGMSDGEAHIEKAVKFLPEKVEAIADAQTIITRVSSYLREKAQRFVEDNEVANYLICITQGFITTFAGEPGTGKTSLCTLLAKSLGLAAATGNQRFVEVSVERGWTSHKDFIGYYNPLTKEIEKSNVEVYNALSSLDIECTHPTNAPFWLLLDEANLSPIEHYWAAFLRTCDFKSSNERTINLGGNNVLHIPDNLRFLATVNFDHTTEDLSPRFLDRSWIIMLTPTQISSESFAESSLENADTVVSFDSLISAFFPQQGDAIPEAVESKWSKIQEIFRNYGHQIMPRNIKMVNRYCLVGCRCMNQGTPESRFSPLDYAVSQKILPLINGSGELYDGLMHKLLEECTNMPICHQHIERMIHLAESNMGYYQFFVR